MANLCSQKPIYQVISVDAKVIMKCIAFFSFFIIAGFGMSAFADGLEAVFRAGSSLNISDSTTFANGNSNRRPFHRPMTRRNSADSA